MNSIVDMFAFKVIFLYKSGYWAEFGGSFQKKPKAVWSTDKDMVSVFENEINIFGFRKYDDVEVAADGSNQEATEAIENRCKMFIELNIEYIEK